VNHIVSNVEVAWWTYHIVHFIVLWMWSVLLWHNCLSVTNYDIWQVSQLQPWA